MEIIVDGNAQWPIEDRVENIFDAVVVIGQKLHEQGRSIMSVQVDDEAVSAEALVDSMKNKPLDTVQRLTITSENTRQLVYESLSEVERSLPELPLACHELATVFQSENPEAGYEPFERLATIWGVIKERELMIANAMEMPLEELTVGGQTVKEFHDDLNGYLLEATQALKSRDSVLLGDLLEYELAPRAEKESMIVDLLKKEAERQAG
ncbi:MAG: hypothetical protein R6V12_17375 [Candidatus Hydrogenedentota bacterium]